VERASSFVSLVLNESLSIISGLILNCFFLSVGVLFVSNIVILEGIIEKQVAKRWLT